MDRYEANRYLEKREIVDLSSASTGLCVAAGCDRAAFPYGIEGHNGYVDTCGAHAHDAIVDCLVNGSIEPIDEQV